MTPLLRVGGLVPLTTVDYPDRLACVIFCQGCAWRCRYCHNPALIPARGEDEIAWAEIMKFLHRRRGMLQAVVFSGGEATLQPGLPAAMDAVRELGFEVGLHSAGMKPRALEAVLPLLDWVGFDIKAEPERVAAITGVEGSGDASWHSLDRVLASGVDHEIRVTWHPHLQSRAELKHTVASLKSRGARHIAVQEVRQQQVLDPALPSPGWNEAVRSAAQKAVYAVAPDAIWRCA